MRAAASSALLQGALTMALPVGLAIGFAGAAYKVWENLSGAKDAAEQLGERVKLAETFHKVAEEVAKIQQGIREIGQTSQQIAVSAMTEAQFRLVSFQLSISQQRAMADSLDAARTQRNSPADKLCFLIKVWQSPSGAQRTLRLSNWHCYKRNSTKRLQRWGTLSISLTRKALRPPKGREMLGCNPTEAVWKACIRACAAPDWFPSSKNQNFRAGRPG